MKTRPPKPNTPLNRRRGRVPYYPEKQADIAQLQQVREEEKTIGSPSTINFVTSVYDALLPRSIKLYQEFSQVFDSLDFFTNSGEMTFTVPLGKTLVLRQLQIQFIAEDAFSPTNPLLLQPNGYQNAGATQPLLLSILQNGTPAEGFSALEIFAPIYPPKLIDCYIIVNGGETFGFNFFIDDPSQVEATGVFRGDLLFTRGNDPNLEPTNVEPVPVRGF